MASTSKLYADIVNAEAQKFRDEIELRDAQLADGRLREIESLSTNGQGNLRHDRTRPPCRAAGSHQPILDPICRSTRGLLTARNGPN